MKFALAGLLLGVATVRGSPECTFETIKPSSELTWCRCEGNLSCARLDVPLDYHKPALGRASVPLIKYPARPNSTDGAYQGIILMNPGGPGASGVEAVMSEGAQLQAATGSNWDIVGFDPRGMYRSTPVVNCSDNSTGPMPIKRDEMPRLPASYQESLIAYGRRLGSTCKRVAGGPKDAGPHMTTTINARDLASILDAFAETEEGKEAKNPRLLNYWGFSYGTFMGQTFASMFPDRVGRMVVDGVVSTTAEQHNIGLSSIDYVDDVLASYFLYCDAAGKSKCPFALGTPRQTYQRLRAMLLQLDPEKAVHQKWANATDIGEALVVFKHALLSASYAPLDNFSNVTEVLLGLEANIKAQNVRPFLEELGPSLQSESRPEYLLGVLASDNKDKFYNATLKDLMPQIRALENQSIIGEAWAQTSLMGTGWSISSDDVFMGPYGGNTSTSMLFVSNTYDPVTPINNSRAALHHFSNAQLLTIDGTGHTSFATGNTCAVQRIKAYFQGTQLPRSQSYCRLEAGPFGIQLNGTLEANLKNAGLLKLY